jgi:NADH-quinone oxidoreductase subunit L
MLYLTCLGLLLPLISFLLLTTTGQYFCRRSISIIGCSSILLSFLSFTALAINYLQQPQILLQWPLWQWIHIDQVQANVILAVDPLTLVMTLVVTGVGFLIHVYSTGYMEHETDYARYFACLNFFIFAMLLLVLAGDLLLLFVGWEAVGLASYLLIGYWYQRPAAAQAATKAFIVNRIGDCGLLIGIFLTFLLFNTTNINDILKLATQQWASGAAIITILALLYFIGATGKSAQIPLHVWLPDAMEGPTPVSALIHAATMVTAGVYLVTRFYPLFLLAPLAMTIVAYIGAATALFAALCAVGQADLKRVLAYSTVSQLGLMFLACGVGAFYAAIFHLVTHAFIKSLLFLSAGNVLHMLHGTTTLEKMGGLAERLKKTHWLFLIGALALGGIPPLAAFFSKEMILGGAYEHGYELLFWVGLAASTLTAFYMIRAYCLTFTGEFAEGKDALQNVQEAPNIMLQPLVVLAILAIGGGALGFSASSFAPLEKLLHTIGIQPQHVEGNLLTHIQTWLAIAGSILGSLAAAVLYTKYRNQLGPTLSWLRQAFYIDQLYFTLFTRPLSAIGKFIVGFLEPKLFEGSLQLTSQLTNQSAKMLQRVQNGQIRSYIAYMIVGTFFLILYLAR